MKAPTNRMRPIHPGEILREEFLKPFDLSANRLAHALDVPTNRITEIAAERRNLTADTALRLARFFETTAEFWMNLQKTFELRSAEVAIGMRLKAIKPIARKGERLGPSASTTAAPRSGPTRGRQPGLALSGRTPGAPGSIPRVKARQMGRTRKAQAASRLSNGRAPS